VLYFQTTENKWLALGLKQTAAGTAAVAETANATVNS